MKYGLIDIDRSIPPPYPPWKKRVLHKELECAGPDEYYLTSVGLWVHDTQKTGMLKGQVIFDYLESTSLLTSCLNLQDGLSIQEKGIVPFRELFGGKAVFLWASAVESENGQFSVPYLYEQWSKVTFSWRWFDDSWDRWRPALVFPQ